MDVPGAVTGDKSPEACSLLFGFSPAAREGKKLVNTGARLTRPGATRSKRRENCLNCGRDSLAADKVGLCDVCGIPANAGRNGVCLISRQKCPEQFCVA